LVSRHLTETTGNLTKSLSPTGGGVGHHGDVLALVTEVLADGDSSVDGSLTGSDRHVGGVGDQAGTLHDRLLAAFDVNGKLWIVLASSCFVVCRNGTYLREVHQDFGHLVTTLTASVGKY
jgi:hypothetical protein